MSRQFTGNDLDFLNGLSAWLGGDLTVMAWVNADTLGSQMGVAALHDNDGNGAGTIACLLSDTGNAVTEETNDAETIGAGSVSSNSVTEDVWQFVCFTSAAGRASRASYVSGTASGGTDTTNCNTITTPTHFLVGKRSGYGERPFFGLIAHVAIWNRVLNSTEINNLAGGDNPLAITGCAAYYAMITNTGGTIPDDVGSNDLTVNGTVAFNASNPTVDAPPAGATLRKNSLMRLGVGR